MPPPDDPVAVFRELFEDSVRLRMRSDVPVGVCLSGGIDSNAIISMMADLRGGAVRYPLQAFATSPKSSARRSTSTSRSLGPAPS